MSLIPFVFVTGLWCFLVASVEGRDVLMMLVDNY